MRFELIKPNTDGEYNQILGFNIWTYKYKSRIRKRIYSGIYFTFDILWRRMGFEIEFKRRDLK